MPSPASYFGDADNCQVELVPARQSRRLSYRQAPNGCRDLKAWLNGPQDDEDLERQCPTSGSRRRKNSRDKNQPSQEQHAKKASLLLKSVCYLLFQQAFQKIPIPRRIPKSPTLILASRC